VNGLLLPIFSAKARRTAHLAIFPLEEYKIEKRAGMVCLSPSDKRDIAEQLVMIIVVCCEQLPSIGIL
jgi:hypothetical protein